MAQKNDVFSIAEGGKGGGADLGYSGMGDTFQVVVEAAEEDCSVWVETKIV